MMMMILGSMQGQALMQAQPRQAAPLARKGEAKEDEDKDPFLYLGRSKAPSEIHTHIYICIYVHNKEAHLLQLNMHCIYICKKNNSTGKHGGSNTPMKRKKGGPLFHNMGI